MKQINQNQKRKFLILVNLLKNYILIGKITEIENKIPSISGLATDAALTAVENKIHNVSSLVKKTDYNAKIKKNLK